MRSPQLGRGAPSIDFNGTKYTAIEGRAADNNISIGRGKFDPLKQPGIALTTQQASALGVKVGDKVSVRDGVTGKVVTATFHDSAGSKRIGDQKLKHFEVSPALADQLGIKYRNKAGKVVDAVTNTESLAGRFSIEKYSGAQKGSGFDGSAGKATTGQSSSGSSIPDNVKQKIASFKNKYTAAPALKDVMSGAASLKLGHRGESVKELQKKLGVKADGFFGPITQRALAAAQQRAGVSVTGNADKSSMNGITKADDGFDAKKEGSVNAGAQVTSSDSLGAKNTRQKLADAATSVASEMQKDGKNGQCAKGVNSAILKATGTRIYGHANQLDTNLVKSGKFKQVNMSLEQALKTPGLVLTWEKTSTRLGGIYGHTAVTLGDGKSSASDFIERNTLAKESGRKGLKIFLPVS
jgi:peptidoglycan hydrolase-like protein with peptidoglycan-binding domain